MAAERVQNNLTGGSVTGLPTGFVFSQSSLQDYVECRRRFLLRYLLRLAWPALQSEPVLESERRMQQGQRFHRLVQQYWLGVPRERLEAMIQEMELRLWWDQFTRFALSLEGARSLYPEAGLSAPLGRQRLVAQYDLVATGEDGRFTIYDWKTSLRKPSRLWLKERLQTRVYPYLLAHAGAGFNQGQPVPPENVEMIYWFPAQPDQPERFSYSAGQYAEDQAYLVGLAQEIERQAQSLAQPADVPAALQSSAFPLTEREERCAYCVYRSLCGRGESAGPLDQMEMGAEDLATLDLRLDFEQIAEIEF